MPDCIFCKIVSGGLPSTQVYSDDKIIVFKDIHPSAPVHLLAIPREHIASSAAGLTAENAGTVGHIFAVIAENHKSWSLENGFRVITNSGTDGKQSVPHLHFHILGGRELSMGMG